MGISVAIITFNEEDNIARCLNSIRDIADEIVVVDSFSTDNTQTECGKYGVKFIQEKFRGYIEQKNYAAELCQNDYVLALDGDEALSEELQKSISHVKQNLEHDGYTFNRRNNYCGTWINYAGWYPDKKLRLWNKNKGKWGGTNPHDFVQMNNQTKIMHLRGDLLHYTYAKPADQYQQLNHFSEIAAKQAYEKGETVVTLFHLILYPMFIFIKTYIFRLGILDGYYGWVISKNEAFFRYMKYMKLKFIWDQKRKAGQK